MAEGNNDVRIGVYICHCGSNIAGTVDVEEVTRFAQGLGPVAVARNYKFMCSEPGQALIKNDIQELGLNRAVVAACSPRMHETTFRRVCEEGGMNPYQLHICNIREQCSWVHKDGATEKAEALIGAAVARAYYLEPLESREVPVTPAVLVVGGGIAGIQAALKVADAGRKVYLVEREPSIGGHMTQIDKTFPTLDCSACILTPRMAAVKSHPNIELMTYSEVVNVQGYVGNFRATVRRKPRYVDESLCTGCGICQEKCPDRYKIYWPPEEVAGPQISPEDQQKVDELLNRYSYKGAPLIPVLQGINAEFNYLPEETLHYVSRRLDLPLAHILRVATFYALFSLEPRGKHVISVCQGTSCFVRGAERLMDRLQEELGIRVGEVTQDRKFSLEVVRCIGCCALAPVFKVGERVHAKVRPKEVAEIVKGY